VAIAEKVLKVTVRPNYCCGGGIHFDSVSSRLDQFFSYSVCLVTHNISSKTLKTHLFKQSYPDIVL